MTNRPPDRVYALPTDTAGKIDRFFQSTTRTTDGLHQAVQALREILQKKDNEVNFEEVLDELHVHSQSLQELAQEGVNPRLIEAFSAQETLLQEVNAVLEQQTQDNGHKRVQFHRKKAEFAGILERKKRELEDVLRAENALTTESKPSEVSQRFKRKKKNEDEAKKSPLLSSLQRQREKTRKDLKGDVFHSTRRYLQFLVSPEYRTRSQVAITDVMINDPDEWIQQFAREAEEDLNMRKEQLEELAQKKSEELQNVMKAQKNMATQTPSSTDSGNLVAKAAEKTAILVKTLQAQENADEETHRILQLVQEVSQQIQQQVELFRSGSVQDLDRGKVLQLRRAHEEEKAARMSADERADEALGTAQDIIAQARASKDRLEGLFRRYQAENNQKKSENQNQEAALRRQIEEMNRIISQLRHELLTERNLRISHEQSRQQDQESFQQDWRRHDEERNRTLEDLREYRQRASRLREMLDEARSKINDANTKIILLEQKPPAAPQKNDELLRVLTELRHLMMFLKQQPSTPAAPDNSAMMMVLSQMLRSLDKLPNELGQISRRIQRPAAQAAPVINIPPTPQPQIKFPPRDPDQALIRENTQLNRLLTERDQLIDDLQKELKALQEELNFVTRNWQQLQLENSQLRKEVSDRKEDEEALANEIEELRAALQEMRSQRDEARDERDQTRLQRDDLIEKRDQYRRERDGAREDRDDLRHKVEQAEQDREIAQGDKAQAEASTTDAQVAQARAEMERDNAKRSEREAESQKNQANVSKSQAEAERDIAILQQAEAEKERDQVKAEHAKAQEESKKADRERRAAILVSKKERSARRETENTLRKAQEENELNQHEIRGLKSENERLKAELEAMRQRLLESTVSPVSITETMSDTRSFDTMRIQHRPGAEKKAHQIGRFQMESISLSHRMQNIEALVEPLGLNSKQCMLLVAHAVNDLDILQEIFRIFNRRMQGNEHQGQSLIYPSVEQSGKKLMNLIITKLSDQRTPFLSVSPEEQILYSLSQAILEQRSEHISKSFVGRNIGKRLLQVVMPPDITQLDLNQVLKRAHERISADKRASTTTLPRKIYRQSHETEEMVLQRLVKSLMPKDSPGIKMYDAMRSVRSQLWSTGQKDLINSEEELRMVKERMRG